MLNRVLFCVLAAILFVGCEANDIEDNFFPHKDLPNNPLPKGRGTLRVLAIGNSYTGDGTAYISEITKGLGIEDSSYCVYTLTQGSTSLEHWGQTLKNRDSVRIYRQAGEIVMPKRKGTMEDILANDWDVVVLQQLSTLATDYASYNPWLQRIMHAVRTYCKNKDVCFAWQLVPAYGKDSPYNKGLEGDRRWEKIAKATQSMMENDHIDIIIPTGTAIQIARHSDLENNSDLTRDNTHLCYGVGRFIAACAWVEKLFSPVYSTDIATCTSTHELTEDESAEEYEGFIKGSSVPVTMNNKSRCLQCAKEACLHPFSLYAE